MMLLVVTITFNYTSFTPIEISIIPIECINKIGSMLRKYAVLFLLMDHHLVDWTWARTSTLGTKTSIKQTKENWKESWGPGWSLNANSRATCDIIYIIFEIEYIA